MRIAVTGSTGYIGQRFLKIASDKGHKVFSLSRRQHDSPMSSWIKYDLSSQMTLSLPADIEAIVHLAANTSFNNQLSEHEEIEASKKLVALAKNQCIKLIFISSQTARSNAPTAYGRIKYCIEQIVIDAGGIVIRPGLVYGGQTKGLFGELVRLVKKFHFIPLFFPGPYVQPIHVDDLANGILRVTELTSMNSSKVIMLGSIEPITFSKFLGAIARYRLHLTRFYIPIPSVSLRLMAGVFSKLGGSISRINSLFNLVEMNTKSDLNFLNLKLRSLDTGLHVTGSSNRRELILEGHAFHFYLVGKDSKKMNMRNYVRIVEKLRDGRSLQIPGRNKFWPFMIALVDDKNLKSYPWVEEYRWRLRTATLISEASPIGAVNFLGNNGSGGFSNSFFGIISALLLEILLKICRLLFRRFFKSVFSKKIRYSHEA